MSKDRGTLTIHPPLNREECVKWNEGRPKFGYKMTLVTESRDEKTPEAIITTILGTRLRPNHHWDLVDTHADMCAFARMFPERRIDGEILFETDKVGVVGRLVIRDGKVKEQYAAPSWPED